MATLFEMADKVKPRTKKIVIGIIMFAVFCVLLPDNKPATRPYTAPVTTPAVKTTPTTSPSLVETLPASAPTFVVPSNNTTTPTTDLNSHIDVPANSPAPITPPAPTINPSFDCTKAQGGIETLICADADLAALDKKVADKYFEKLLKAPKESAEEIKNDQRDFLKFRTTACSIPPVIKGTPVGKFIPCLMNIYGQRLTSFDQPAAAENPAVDSELPWLKEERLKKEADPNEDHNEDSTPAPAKPVFNQQDFNACMDGDLSRCHVETLNPQQQAIVVQGLKRNYSSCLNGLTYACNRNLLTPEMLERVQQSDLQRNYSSCLNGLSYACNKTLLTTDQQLATNKSDMQRNLNACLNGLSYSCNKQWLSPEQREEANRRDLQRNYNNCLNGLTFQCNRALLSPDQLSKMNK